MVYRNNAGRLGVTLALCVLRNTLAGSKNSVSICRNGTVQPRIHEIKHELFCGQHCTGNAKAAALILVRIGVQQYVMSKVEIDHVPCCIAERRNTSCG